MHKVKEAEEQETNKEDFEATGILGKQEISTNQQSEKSQHRLPSQGKFVLCAEDGPSKCQTETCSETLSFESSNSTFHTVGKVQA